ncbi:DUF4381 domain-containing protein [Thiocystis violacea]|uniref:DUF4381 domain-containing protein n=1 Tax=Thiocystis violacea TaxID=13725 RepID=UPI001908EBCA|nr:DUF4381 domain-containing protein [Thiocystis violacea]MBK1718935.1 hypothetical protein [Thiocystis violacea]
MDPILTPLQPVQTLRDIRDIPPIPWWPPAPGWWLLLLALILIGYLVWRWRAPLSLRIPIPGLTLGTWRWDAASALRDLGRRARAGQDVKTTLGELSELLRRIAMARLGRAACAGLTGSAWLDWLSAHDPNGFPWHEHGRLLLVAPYAPPSGVAGDIQILIRAAEAWVSAREPGARPWRPWRLTSTSRGVTGDV